MIFHFIKKPRLIITSAKFLFKENIVTDYNAVTSNHLEADPLVNGKVYRKR